MDKMFKQKVNEQEKPQYVIDVENEKRFFESHGEDYCKHCENKYYKVTGVRRCCIFLKNSTVNEQDGHLAWFTLECILEHVIVVGYGMFEEIEKEKHITRQVTREDLRQIYG